MCKGKWGETVDGRRLYVAIVEWDDSDRKGKDRRASGFRMVGLDCRDISCVQIVRCHVKFSDFLKGTRVLGLDRTGSRYRV